MTHTNIAFCEGTKQILLTQEESALDSAKNSISHKRTIPSSKRFENTTVTGT